MKTRNLFWAILLTLCSNLFAQTKPLYFTYPTNGTVISIPEGQSTVSVTIHYTYSGLLGINELHKLFATQNYESRVYPYNLQTTFTLGAGTYTWKLERWIWEFGLGDVQMTPSDEITFYVRPTITVRNSFSAGTVTVNSQNVNSGFRLTPEPGSSTSVSAIDQYYSNYNRLFNNWTGAISSTSRSESISAPTSSSVTATANFLKEYNIDFVNNIGSTYVNFQLYTSSIPTSYVRQNNSITASGNWTSTNGIEYSFTGWTKSGQSYSSTFTPTDHGTYTAVYTGKPTNSGEYVSAGAPVGQPIVVTWTDNPNTAVNQVQIWRRVKHNGVVGSDVLLTTVGRGVQTYTDYEYVATDGYTHDLLWYDVRAYYSAEGTYSVPDFTSAFGRIEASTVEDKLVVSLLNELPANYSISNYPNPFNPTTTINYQLPENGFVSIKVYDMLGKEIATLVDGNRVAGYHKVNFDASRLTSGIYIYTITANNFIQSKKMLLMK